MHALDELCLLKHQQVRDGENSPSRHPRVIRVLAVPEPARRAARLTAAELGDAEDADDGSEMEDEDVQFVTLLMNGRPALGLEIPGMQNSPSRKRAPPPTLLVLSSRPPSASTPTVPISIQLPHVAPPPAEEEDTSATPPEGVNHTRLAYLDGERESEPAGNIYDAMDLGFEVGSDNLAQFSPRMLRTELEEMLSFGSSSLSLSPPGSSTSAFGQFPTPSSFMPVSNTDVFPPTLRLPHHPDIYNGEEENFGFVSRLACGPVQLARRAACALPRQTALPAQLAVSGVSASMPKRFHPGIGATGATTTGSSSRASSLHSTTSSESELRKRDLAEHYPTEQFELTAYSAVAGFVRAPCVAGAEPPVVIPAPASPPNQAEVQRKSSNGSSSDPRASLTATMSSSRFSTDSIDGADAEAGQTHAQKQANRTTLMSVKSIKNLWRKS
ncbi:hypothetical protein B0H12DRAFT_1237321 [Mycena haematopus]|nr:hypothetical protein B0H12DRAFT_1237321 [Mycena haematopus]